MVNVAPWPSLVGGIVFLTWGLSALTFLAWVLARHGQPCRKWKLPRLIWASRLGWQQKIAWLGMCRGVEDDDMFLKIQQMADEHTLERIRDVLPMMACLMLLSATSNFIFGYQVLTAEDNTVLLHKSSQYFFLGIEILGFMFYVQPSTLTKSALRLGGSLILVRGIFLTIIADYDIGLSRGNGDVPEEVKLVFSYILRLWMNFMIQDTFFLLASHAVVAPTTLAIIVIQGREGAIYRCGLEILVTVIVCTASLSLERATKASIFANLQAQSSKALEGAADAMLSSLCDAVVHLSPSFDLTKDCPRLSALLLREPWVPLRANFCDLCMSESDKQAFARFINAGAQADKSIPLADTTHVTLRDANSMPVLVQLFHTMCIGAPAAGEVHIVGIRDAGGERHVMAQDEEARNSLGALMSPTLDHCQRSLVRVDEGTISSTQESDTTTQESGSITRVEAAALSAIAAALEEDGGGAAKVWISTLDLALPILKWTPGFLSLLGISVVTMGVNLRDFIPTAPEQHALLRKLQDLTNSMVHGEGPSSAMLQFRIATKHVGDIHILAKAQLDWGLAGGAAVAMVLECQPWDGGDKSRGLTGDDNRAPRQQNMTARATQAAAVSQGATTKFGAPVLVSL